MAALDQTFLLYSPLSLHRESVLSPRYHWDNSRRGEGRFVIIQKTISGHGVFRFEGVEHPIPVDHAFIAIVPEDSVYYYPKEGHEPWKFSWMNLYGDFATRLIGNFRAAHGPVLPLSSRTKSGMLFERLSGGHERPVDPYTNSALCYQFLMEWARELAAPRDQERSAVQIALDLCAVRFREQIGVKELADASGLTREHFTRIFTQQTGNSPARHLRDLRTRAAREMMSIKGIPLKEIVLRCGFPSVRSLKNALDSNELT